MFAFGIFGTGVIAQNIAAITGISPSIVAEDDLITVTGYGFGYSVGTITINDVAQTPLTWDDGEVTFAAVGLDVAAEETLLTITNTLNVSVSTSIDIGIFEGGEFLITPATIVVTGVSVQVIAKRPAIWAPVDSATAEWSGVL